MIGWPIAFVLVFIIVTLTALTAQWMANRHEYRMARLEQDTQIVENINEQEKEKETV